MMLMCRLSQVKADGKSYKFLSSRTHKVNALVCTLKCQARMLENNIDLAMLGPYAEEEPEEDHLDRALPQVTISIHQTQGY